MRKKPWLIGTAIGLCAVLLAGYAGASMGLWRGERPFTEDWAARQRAADDADWSVLEQGQAVLENERFRFELQADTTHFTVTDRATGRIYRSVPEETVDAGELADRAFSEVSIQYYNDQSQPQEMHSTPQGVEAGGATVKQGGDAVRVYYTIGEKKSGWAPLLIARSVYEDALLDTLSASEKRRMNRYYSLMEPGAEDFEEKAQTYPCLREGDYYLLTDDLQDRYLEEIAEYLQRIGYTQEAYAKDCEAWGLPAPADGDDSPAFELAVEYRLTADGFSAELLTDKVKGLSDAYTLQSVTLLEFFGSVAAGDHAYLVPDGSGALISLKGAEGLYTQRLYGADPAVQRENSAQIAPSALLPVFGLCSKDQGFFAIIEGGAAEATLTANRRVGTAPLNAIYAAFSVRASDVTTVEADTRVKPYNLYAKHTLYEHPRVRYVLDAGVSADYSSMAGYYRDYLTQQGTLSRRTDASAPLFLDFTGLVRTEKTLLGIPYTGRMVLTTLSELEAAVQSLQGAGIHGATVRLTGSGSDGLTPTAGNGFSLYGGVGQAEDLQRLAQALLKDGGRLYLENDVSRAYRYSAFSPFNPNTDGIRRLNRKIAIGGDIDRVLRDANRLTDVFRYVSPAAYPAYAETIVQTGRKTVGDWKTVGLSFSSAGQFLASDMRAGREYDRCMAAEMTRQALEAYAAAGGVMTDGGNGYVLGKADTVLGLPLTASMQSVETKAVPFYAMVAHGSIRYAGPALNLSEDPETALLNSVESGAALYYSCVTRLPEELYTTPYARERMPAAFETVREELEQAYARYGEQARQVQGQYIVRHAWLTDAVTETVYESGTRVLVNHGEQDAQIDGTTIPARDFLWMAEN